MATLQRAAERVSLLRMCEYPSLCSRLTAYIMIQLHALKQCRDSSPHLHSQMPH